MPCIVRSRKTGAWSKLLISEQDAVVIASATLNAIARHRDDLHDGVLYIADDEDADRLLVILNEPPER
ncbi:MAG: hypothetical protein OXG82_01740 [Gammaproteobacteria bacterium]|nr:hypothetical protein [Gammaproteobacteria bacterium]